MRVAFRVDASATIGTGHVSRCLALANTLEAARAQCVFFCVSAGIGPLQQKIVAAGHAFMALDPERPGAGELETSPPHAHWVPHGWRADVSACQSALRPGERFDWLIVDHYGLDHHWEGAMRSSYEHLMVMDDLADREHLCELLLDQNPMEHLAGQYRARVPSDCTILIGPHYALLRPEFQAARERAMSRRRDAAPRRLIVMFGGADELDITGTVVDALIEVGFPGHVDVVAGPLYGSLEKLRSKIARLPSARLHVASNEVASLMAAADAAIGSPGVTSYERCVVGLPTLAIAVALNQAPLGQVMDTLGCHRYLGRAEELSQARLCSALRDFLGDARALHAQSVAAAALCDGKGTQRISELLLARADPRSVSETRSEQSA